MPSRCAQHGLAVAPDGKCVRCRREEEAASEVLDLPKPPATERTRVIVLGIAIGALTIGGAVAYVVTMRRQEAVRAASATVSAATASAPRSAVRAESPAPPLAPLVSVALPPDPTSSSARSGTDETSERLRSEMHHVPITMYSSDRDPACKRARTWLLANGYPFTDRDVEHDAEAARARSAITSADTVPVLDVGGQPVIGFDPERVTRALEYAAARRLQR
jgi:glutaredoxin 3